MKEKILEDIIKDYKSGSSLRKLKDKYNYSVGNLHYHLKKKNVLRNNGIVHSIKSDNQLLIGAFIGLWAGDGSKFIDRSAHTIKVHINKNQEELIQFIENMIFELFFKKISHTAEEKTNQCTIRFFSKFIYNFIDEYLDYRKNKKLTVKLKKNLNDLDEFFLKGFLLGVTLSDGYFKDRFVFSSISKGLIRDVFLILCKFGFDPRITIQDRSKYGWYEINRLYLIYKESGLFKSFLNDAIACCGSDANIDSLKGY